MIHIESNTTSCKVRIPRTLTEADGVIGFYALSLTGCTSGVTVDATITDFVVVGDYYEVSFSTASALRDGEYRYDLTKESILLSTGILRVGEVGSAVTTAETPNKITYTTAK